MNRNYNILSGALLLLVSGTCFQSCQQDDFGDLQPDIETLVAEGRYLTARSVDASELASDTEEPRLFAVGTPYRLLAFTNPYNKDITNTPRFNKVAWEGETSTGMRFINIDSEPDKWFGFSALDGETGGDDNLVSLDFYGFTYGKKVDNPGDYIPVDGWKDDRTTKPSDLTYTETVTDGILNDLMRGVLLNQNIQTAGKSDDGKTNNAYTQSIMPFKHCFSKLRFQISQQGDEDKKDADGNPTLSFENLYVEKIEVTNTYGTGKVFLHNGKVELSGDPCDRNLPFKAGFSGQVTTKNTDVGDMIVFPSDGSALTGTTMGDGYNVGLSITVRSTEEKDIENMLVNTGSVGKDGKPVIEEIIVTNDDGTTTTWYQGTIHKDNIVDYYNTTPEKEAYLHFKQNTSYMLIITFQKDAVRIITVIPQVEEWLPGEGDAEDPWQEQALGQPQMFNNIVWSDRNLGADHYDPTTDHFEETVGYFYQAGRNIPYYPFKWGKDITDASLIEEYYYPDVVADMYKQDLINGSSEYGKSEYAFYPVVDPSILKMYIHKTNNDKPESDPGHYLFDDQNKIKNLVNFQWSMWGYDWNGKPQMFIPESRPSDNTYFNFMRRDSEGGKGLTDDNNMQWELGQSHQPVSGEWIIPSSKEFLSIFPSTPHAGNITFRKGYYNGTPMGWGDNSGNTEMDAKFKTLRVTVPYYYKGMAEPTDRSSDYIEAWNTLATKNDVGTTHIFSGDNAYNKGPGYINTNENNPMFEPEGDPSGGYASVYIISRKSGTEEERAASEGSLFIPKKLPNNAVIKSWGTIYGIKCVYTSQAYRMRWRVLEATKIANNPCYYVEICRYRCQPGDNLTEENYMTYDWDHPAARLYFPICGLGDWTGEYINFGTECQYATSDAIVDGKTSVVQIKISGNDPYNSYISIIRNAVKRDFGMQIRPVRGGKSQ